MAGELRKTAGSITSKLGSKLAGKERKQKSKVVWNKHRQKQSKKELIGTLEKELEKQLEKVKNRNQLVTL